MADLIIRGMDFGNTMTSCPFHADDGYGDCYCVAGIDCHAPFDEHPEDCPVTILPEGHGRLIDADDLIDEMCLAWEYDEITNAEWTGIREWLNHAPTIVPADVPDINVGNKKEGGTDNG